MPHSTVCTVRISIVYYLKVGRYSYVHSDFPRLYPDAATEVCNIHASLPIELSIPMKKEASPALFPPVH